MLARQVQAESTEAAPLTPAYASRALQSPVSRYRLPKDGMEPSLAYQLIHDELQLDGNPELNLASFVTTWMEPEADRLMAESAGRNYVDADEYPRTTEIHNRCVNILADLFHAPEAVGTATVGSSEAIHLAGLALKWRWRARREARGLPGTRPNIVMGANVQVCWEKFARYFEVEPRYVPLREPRYVLGVEEAVGLVDENTIAVVAILGSTYTGEYEPVEELDRALSELAAKGGPDVPIHVDGASGGFVAPFSTPDLRWDFRLDRVRSINVSGHKYGLVYPGVGWALWRTAEDLPDELVFHVNYLGADQPTFNLNFSRGASQILAQYYNFLRLGRSGYSQVIGALSDTASYLTEQLSATGDFQILSKPGTLPVVCFGLSGDPGFTVFDVSAHLRARGWIVPAYTLAPDASDVSVLRIVVREGLSRDMADLLLGDLSATVAALTGMARSSQQDGTGAVEHCSRHARGRALGTPRAAEHSRHPTQKPGTQGVC
ncbi:MAG: glutamate decarboxylase [Actinomycetota bacterium]|nr:glutamate decarboxylase [Actinomycetota bacterium]